MADQLPEMHMFKKGSREDEAHRIMMALHKLMNERETWIQVESTTDTSLILKEVKRGNGKPSFWTVDWSIGEDGEVAFDNWQEVELDIVTTAISESILAESKSRGKEGWQLLDETLESATLELSESGKYKLEVANVANQINSNSRRYLPEAIEAAVKAAQKQIENGHPLLCELRHDYNPDGTYKRNLRECVAAVWGLSYNPARQSISLDEVTPIGTEAGNDFKAIVEAGVPITTSQRGWGKSRVLNEDGKMIQEVYELDLKGFDFFEAGEESVKHPGNKLILAEDTSMDMEARIKQLETQLAEATAQLKTLAEAKPPEVQKPKPESNDHPKDDPKYTALMEKVESDGKELAELKAESAARKLAEKRADLKLVTAEIVKSELADEKYKQYNAGLKNRMCESVVAVCTAGVDTIADLSDRESVKAYVLPLLANEQIRTDGILAELKLKATGFDPEKPQSQPSGITHIEDRQGAIPNEQFIVPYRAKLAEELRKAHHEFRFQFPDDHPVVKEYVEPHLALFDQQNAQQLWHEEQYWNGIHNRYPERIDAITKQLSGGRAMSFSETVLAANVQVTPISISRIVIELALRSTRMLEVMDNGIMTQISEQQPLLDVLPAEGDYDTDLDFMEPYEGSVNEVDVDYQFHQIGAVRQALKTRIHPNAIAIARGTSINPQFDAIRAVTGWLQRGLDRRFARHHVVFAFDTGRVQQTASFEALNQIGSTLEWAFGGATAAIGDKPLQPWEWVVTADANGNPKTAHHVPLFGYPVGSPSAELSFQAIEVQDDNDATAFIYGTDYTINFASGTITLTAAGETKRGADGLEGKYTTSTAVVYWDVTQGATETREDYGYRFGEALDAAKQKVVDFEYMADKFVWHPTIEGKIATTPYFSNLNRLPSSELRTDATVARIGGIPEPLATTAMPKEWIPVFQNRSVLNKVQTALTVEQTGVDENGVRNFLAQQYSASGAPVVKKIALIGIGNIEKL